MKKLICLLSLAVLAVFTSCEKVFPDENLDNYWKLKTIEYKSGFNFKGEPCKVENVSDFMFGFARHLVQIENVTMHYEKHGITQEIGDSIKFDFSIYSPSFTDTLKLCGMDNRVTVFKLEYPDSKSMKLSGSKTILSFEKW